MTRRYYVGNDRVGFRDLWDAIECAAKRLDKSKPYSRIAIYQRDGVDFLGTDPRYIYVLPDQDGKPHVVYFRRVPGKGRELAKDYRTLGEYSWTRNT